jgi:hypothetical protein
MRPKTPTTRSPFLSGTALSSTDTRVPVLETRTPVASVDGEVPSTFWEKSSRARASVLGRDDGGEMATSDVAEKLLGRRVDPADDPGVVEDVARDADVFESPLDVTADCQARAHDRSVADLPIEPSALISEPQRKRLGGSDGGRGRRFPLHRSQACLVVDSSARTQMGLFVEVARVTELTRLRPVRAGRLRLP